MKQKQKKADKIFELREDATPMAVEIYMERDIKWLNKKTAERR